MKSLDSQLTLAYIHAHYLMLALKRVALAEMPEFSPLFIDT